MILREATLVGQASAVRLGIELALAVRCRVLGRFTGMQWHPHRVCFTHAAPAERTLRRRVVGPGVKFGHDFNGVVIRPRELDVPTPSADPAMARRARKVMETSRGARATTRRRRLATSRSCSCPRAAATSKPSPLNPA